MINFRHADKKVFLASLVMFFIAWAWIYSSALESMVNVWISSETFKHCFIILPVVLFLFYERRKELGEIEYKPVYWLIIPLFLIQLLHLFGMLLGVNLLGHLSAYLSIVVIAWMLLGNEFIRRFKFPLLFLAFVVPVGEELVPFLQDITAYMSVKLLQLSGIPIYREGLYLYVPNGTFLVAEACAGIRFLIAAIALGTLYAYLNFQTKWKFFGFILLSIIVPIVANSVRAYGIVVIGYLSDMKYATGADHLVYGWFFFAFVLVILFLIGELGKEKVDYRKSTNQRSLRFSVSPLFFVFALIVSISPIIYAKAVIFSKLEFEQSSYLSDSLDGLSESTTRFDWAPLMINPHEEWHGYYKNVPLYVAKYAFDNAEHELVSGLNRQYNIEVYTRKSIRIAETAKGKIAILDLVNVSGKRVQLAYWYEVDGIRTVSSLSTKLNQMYSKLRGDGGKGYFVAIAHENPEEAAMLIPLMDID